MRHLVRRFAGSLSRREPALEDTAWAESQLLECEVELWRQLSPADRRHAITVAQRFEPMGSWTREELAGALLHDIGKLVAGLGTWTRVVATATGPRTARFRQYHDHERIGADMLADAGSSPATVELVRGQGRAAPALLDADNV